MASHFDPGLVEKQVNEMTPAEFGILVARYIKEHPHSQNWLVVNEAAKLKTGWYIEHDQVRILVERIAGETPCTHS